MGHVKAASSRFAKKKTENKGKKRIPIRSLFNSNSNSKALHKSKNEIAFSQVFKESDTFSFSSKHNI